MIGEHVTIGDNNVIGDYAVIRGGVTKDDDNFLGNHVDIGAIPTNSQIKYEFNQPVETSRVSGRVVIGNGNVIREFTNIGLPTKQSTTIKNECYIMPHCHIAHDTLIEDKAILSNHSSPGRYSQILEGANLGKGVHKRTRESYLAHMPCWGSEPL